MNSKLFVVAGIGAWYLTFLLGFFILAPSTDDGYYIIASLGTALTGSPGFWIGDDFAPVFFLPIAFTYFYGLLLKLTMVLGFDFGPFGFRFYQFLFILLLPVLSAVMLRRLFPRDYGIRLLVLLVFLSLTYFVQSAATVRPEVLGAVLFISFLTLRGNKFLRGTLPIFFLALSGTVHPIFSLLAVVVFGVGRIREYHQFRFKNLSQWFGSAAAFALPFAVLGIYYAINLTEFQEQTLGRASFLSTDAWTSPTVVLNNLLIWNNTAGISFGLFSGYPAFGFLLIMLISTTLVLYRHADLWRHEILWVAWPMLFVQWVVFLLLPPFLPYLAFSSFLASLNIALLWQQSNLRTPGRRLTWTIASAGFALCLVFITFQAGKFLLTSEERLTPAGLHSVMSPVLGNTESILYTDSARLIPPLIDHFFANGNIRLNLIYLSPDCLQPRLLKLANQHTSMILTKSDPQNTYWGLDRKLVRRNSNQSADGAISFMTKGANSTVTLLPADQIYADNKNLIIRASSVIVKIDDHACLVKEK